MKMISEEQEVVRYARDLVRDESLQAAIEFLEEILANNDTYYNAEILYLDYVEFLISSMPKKYIH